LFQSNCKRPLVVLCGPTGVGKTSFSIPLAKDLSGEIVSCDSMQVYKGMDIGSAKIHPSEMEGVPHYLVDEIDPKEEFHVALFQSMAKQAVKEIYSHKNLPILVGGTGFYLQSFLFDADFSKDGKDLPYREMLEEMARGGKEAELFSMLKKIDPASCEEIHPHNVKRVIRALEFYHITGEPISVHNQREKEKISPYDYVLFVLTDERSALYDRINRRVDRMMEEGLLEEVKALKASGLNRNYVSMQGLGYKELFAYLDGECSLNEAVDEIKESTRHFAKRQLTWFRNKTTGTIVDLSQFDYDRQRVLTFMEAEINARIGAKKEIL